MTVRILTIIATAIFVAIIVTWNQALWTLPDRFSVDFAYGALAASAFWMLIMSFAIWYDRRNPPNQ